MARAVQFAFIMLTVACLAPVKTLAQGETTSAIVGQVRDATNAVVPGAIVTITNSETGLRRGAKTDDSGRFNFPQLKPGIYSVKVEASGFEPRQSNNVVSALGQKQTVDFTLGVARSRETVEVSSESPILNPENANTSTTLSAPASADCLEVRDSLRDFGHASQPLPTAGGRARLAHACGKHHGERPEAHDGNRRRPARARACAHPRHHRRDFEAATVARVCP